MKVEDYMSSEVVTVSPRDTLAMARNLMFERGVRRLVVVDGGKVVGVITASDIARALSRRGPPWKWRNPENSLVERFMTRDPVTVGPDERITRAAALMVEKGIGGLPVVEDGSLVGIITETDVTRFYSERVKGVYKVADLLSEDYEVVDGGTSVKRVAKIVASGRRVVLVREGGRIRGIITDREIALWEPELAKKYVLIPSPTGRMSVDIRGKRASQIAREISVRLTPEEDAAKAARYLIEWGVNSLPVFRGDELVGVIGKKEIVGGAANAGI